MLSYKFYFARWEVRVNELYFDVVAVIVSFMDTKDLTLKQIKKFDIVNDSFKQMNM